MYDKELTRVEKRIKRAVNSGKFLRKKIYIFGVSDNTRQIISILREYDIKVVNILDNDITKQGAFCSGVKVISPSSIENPTSKDRLYIMYSAYWREMIAYLKNIGVTESNIWRLNLKAGNITRLFWSAHKGNKQIKQIKRIYGDVPIFLCPYTGTGDIYLIGSFWEEYIKKNRINDYVFIVITGACKKVASLFDIKNVILLKKKYYASEIIDYYLYTHENISLKILNDCWPQEHINQIEWFRGYKGLYFTELFRRFVFNLPDDCIPKHPTLKDEHKRVGQYFGENGLQYGRTVVLAPYSNTLTDLPIDFWVEVVKRLKNQGYSVVTNSSGKSEPVIPGTSAVFFSLDIAPQFVEYAGFFIGVRSGLCDVISSARALKIVLYDAGNRFYMGSAFEYFSLIGMELSNDVKEYEFLPDKIDTLVDMVLSNFQVL